MVVKRRIKSGHRYKRKHINKITYHDGKSVNNDNNIVHTVLIPLFYIKMCIYIARKYVHHRNLGIPDFKSRETYKLHNLTISRYCALKYKLTVLRVATMLPNNLQLLDNSQEKLFKQFNE
jgi:hypothetical protein